MHRLPPPSLSSLAGLLDDVAIVEHARLRHADGASGHCVDDAGRALVVACEAPGDPLAGEVARRCTRFLAAMHVEGGRFRLRDGPRAHEVWSSDDGSGRAIHGLGVAAAVAPWRHVRTAARSLVDDLVAFDSQHLRAVAHAVLGLTAVLDAGAGSPRIEEAANRLASRLEQAFATVDDDPSWPWPEPRLAYANGVLVEARLAHAARSRDRGRLRRSLATLRWLVATESRDGHLSPTPVGGWAPGEPRPGFDQQPIEVWAIADAARRALGACGDPRWSGVVATAASWFAGANDASRLMWDPATGRAFDGLERDGVNRNEGAESTLAFVATLLDLRAVERRVGKEAVRQAAREVERWSSSTR